MLHVESGEPVTDPVTGAVIKDYTYVYFKNANEQMDRPGLQGGTVPVELGPTAVTDPVAEAAQQPGAHHDPVHPGRSSS